jgi:GTP-binding protein
MTFTVAIVGRPNVGKSTLFNRLVGKKLALVDDTPGVTRDRRPGDAKLVDLRFTIIDTAGLEEADEDTLEGRMRAQTEAAIDEADLTLFVVDAKFGLTPLDNTLGEMLRRRGKPVVLVANKSEARGSDAGFYDAYALGLGEPCPISAEHGEGMLDLRDAIVAAIGEDKAFADEDVAETDVALPPEPELDENGEEIEPAYDETKPLRIAVVGRPNAGKSTLINRFLGEDRLLVGPEAGITRDSISVEWTWRGRTVKMFDTAGMRKRARVTEKLEKLSVADALRAVRFAETVVIVFDATIPFEKQDLHIVDFAVREGRAVVLAFNKWDLIEDRQKVLADLREKTDRLLPQIRGVRAVTVSGQTGDGLDRLMQAVVETDKIWNKRVSTAKLNRWLEFQTQGHPPPAVSGRRIKLKYMTQVKARPPGFIISCSRPEALAESYTRYLINGLRDDFGLTGVPIRISYRGTVNPFEGKKDNALKATRRPAGAKRTRT